jgi:prepilin-type N-terminal cleavage/methylation domain-containing protein
MKLSFIELGLAVASPTKRQQALTLVEMMTTMAIFGLVMAGLISAHIFGLQENELVLSKLGAGESSRRGFDLLARDVRAAKIWQIGNIAGTTNFVPIANGTAQQGTALQLCLSTATNQYIRYYFDTNKFKLFRIHSNVSGSNTIAQYLTNNMFFRAETYSGATQTDLSHKGVIHVMLQFSQYQYPMVLVGGGCYYDFYKIEFRLTPHVPDGP